MLMTAGAMWLLDRFIPIASADSSLWQKLGLLIIFLAIFTDGFSLIQFFRAHTTINPLHPEKTEKLVTTGMYAISRNPMYCGLLYLLIGWGLVLGSVSPFMMLPVFVIVITRLQIIPEEAILEVKFGQQYRDYKNTVRRWFWS